MRTQPYREPELVLYGPYGAEVLAHGRALNKARILATSRVFVVLLWGKTAALIGTDDGRLEQVDLYDDLGLEHVTIHAVDPSGERLLLADRRRVRLTDAALEPLSADGWWEVPEQHGTVESAVFLSPEEFVTVDRRRLPVPAGVRLDRRDCLARRRRPVPRRGKDALP
ncbi:hypothetical protein ACFWJ4_18820 [Kitasatospora sp. NPDC127067]|uniref:hypothetical protein n=1 Tax=Kitasatospora sp. NPDC127067 TaxID=3347126 RepID=UPI00365ED7A9